MSTSINETENSLFITLLQLLVMAGGSSNHRAPMELIVLNIRFDLKLIP